MPETPASSTSLGYGGKPTWQVVQENVMSDVEKARAALPQLGTEERLAGLTSTAESMISGLRTSAEKIQKISDEQLAGQLPADVQAQIRQVVSERAGKGGLFGQAARALTARDIGRTSYEMQQSGIEGTRAAASMQEAAGKMAETIRQYDADYQLRSGAYLASLRDQNLRGIALEQERLQFNATQNMRTTEMIVDLVKSQQATAYNYAALGTDSSGMITTYQNWISQLQKLLT